MLIKLKHSKKEGNYKMKSEVVLLDFWPSPFGMRVRLALAEKGVTYEYKEEDLSNKSELLLQMNPVHKKIPVLVHNNKPVCESLNAIEYIDEVWNSNNLLLPSDPYQRAQARFWADYVDTQLFDSVARLVKTKGVEQEEAKKDFIESLKVMEQQLGDNPYFGGDTFGFVDVAFFPFYPWFYSIEIAGNFKVEELCPNIIEWGKRCLLRDSVKVLPDQNQVYEYYFVKMLRIVGNE